LLWQFHAISTSTFYCVYPLQVRRAVYLGSYTDLLSRLSVHPAFRHLMGTKQVDAREKDQELILRFFAVWNMHPNNVRGEPIEEHHDGMVPCLVRPGFLSTSVGVQRDQTLLCRLNKPLTCTW